ncbi:ABC transporter permease [Microbacterium sp.]|uniref:ABC transporter permease n=1 Tax=Microbacterium sp. TaxID=51671 RepID=UPI003A8C63B9
MSPARLGTLVRLDLLQRLRSIAWYVLLGVFALLLLGATVLSQFAFGVSADGWGSGVYSVVVYITLLLVMLVSPTLSGNSINGDRDGATLAPVQVTLATTGEILWAKFLAAWVTGLAFVVVAVPFLVFAALTGAVSAATGVVAVAVLIVEAGIVAAIGVAVSGLLSRPLFSVATTYLVVAALTVGTVIGFGLIGTAIRSDATMTSRDLAYDPVTGEPICIDGATDCEMDPRLMECGPWTVDEYTLPRYDTVWWLLAANPFVILADATPTTFDRYGSPQDLFGQVKVGIRFAQLPPDLDTRWDGCAGGEWSSQNDQSTAEEMLASTIPSWFVGLGVQVLLAAGLLWGAWMRMRTPARRLPRGSRIA